MLLNAYNGFGAIAEVAADGDQHYDKVWSLLHFNDSITDQKGNTWSGSTPTYDTGVFGNALKISASNTYISTPAPSGSASILGAADFTIEFWFKTTNASAACDLLHVSLSGTGYANINLYMTGGNLKLRSSSGGTGWDIDATVTALSTDTFSHFALVRTGTSLIIYKDGVNVYSTNSLSSMFSYLAGTAIRIGTYSLTGTASLFFEEFRLTKYFRRYTVNFTPPLAPFPDTRVNTYDPFNTSVISLLQFEGNLTDAKGVSWTAYGGATTSGGDLTLSSVGDFILADSSLSIGATTQGCFEFLATITQAANGAYHAICSSNSGSGSRWVLSSDTSNNLAIFTSAAGAWQTTGFTLANVQNVRKHFAICTDGNGNIRLAVDGVWGTSRTGSFLSTASRAIIGRMDTSVADYYCALTMGAWRVTSGDVRYGPGIAFTPPTSFP